MCILYSDYVDLIECVFYFMVGSLSFVSKFFITGMCIVVLASVAKTISGATFHTLIVVLSIND